MGDADAKENTDSSSSSSSSSDETKEASGGKEAGEGNEAGELAGNLVFAPMEPPASKAKKPKGRSQAATSALRENLKLAREETKATKAELRDKAKEFKDLENKFKRWRARNPNKGLAKAFDALAGPVSEEKMKEMLTAFALETKSVAAFEFLTSEHIDTTSRENTEGKRYVDYNRVCLYYGLAPEHMEDGVDVTFQKLISFEKLGWISKQKAAARARSYAKKHGLPIGTHYDWYIKEARSDTKDVSASSTKYYVEKDMKNVQTADQDKVLCNRMWITFP